MRSGNRCAGRGKLGVMSDGLSLRLVTLAMRQSRGVISEAATALDVTFGVLHRWLKEHREEVAELMEEVDAMLVDDARKVLRESIEAGGLKASFFVLERKDPDWARRSKSEVNHRLEVTRAQPHEFLPPVVDERQLAVEQSRQLTEAQPSEIPDAEVEELALVDEPVSDQAGGPYGPCPRCAANLSPPGAWAQSMGAKGSCSSCGYPAVEAPQTMEQLLQRH